MTALHTVFRCRSLPGPAVLLFTSLACLSVEAAPFSKTSAEAGAKRVVVLGEPARSSPAKDDASKRGPLAPLPTRSAAMLRLNALPEPARSKVSLDPSAREFPLQIGKPRDTLQASISRLRIEWSAPVEGRRTARLSVNSEGAKALRVALRTDSSQEMEIRVQGSAHPVILGARREADPRGLQGDVWTPVTDGEQQDIELSIADRPDLPLPQITVPLISHFSVPILRTAPPPGKQDKFSGAAGACTENVVCLPNPGNAFLNAARATVKLVFTRQGSSYSCSGTLINDNQASTQIPYILTAAHCVDAQATAASTNAYFSSKRRPAGHRRFRRSISSRAVPASCT